MSSDGDATEPASTVRHSYPPPAAVTSAEQVQTTGLGRRSSHGGEDTSKSNIGETSGTARPPTRASSYATADERDDEGSAIGAARPDSASQAASPSQIAAAAADAHEGGGDGEEEARSSRSRRDEDSDNHSISSSLDTTAMTPAAQLRLSLARRLWSGVTQLRSRSRRALLFQGAFTIAQVAAYIVMLALSAHQSCEKPLRVFIALHVIRVALAYPVAFYIALAPPG